MCPESRERGNVLFLILIAVVLFAALSFVVTSSTRSGSGNASREETAVLAGQLLQYGAYVESAVMRLRMAGYEDYQINWGQETSNPNCPSDLCHLRRPSGGGIPRNVLPPLAARDPARTTCSGYGWNFTMSAVIDVGTNLPDVLIQVSCVRRDVCEAVNTQLTGAPIVPTSVSLEPRADLNGVLPVGQMLNPFGQILEEASAASFRGSRALCYCVDGSCQNNNDYRFFYVVMAR